MRRVAGWGVGISSDDRWGDRYCEGGVGLGPRAPRLLTMDEASCASTSDGGSARHLTCVPHCFATPLFFSTSKPGFIPCTYVSIRIRMFLSYWGLCLYLVNHKYVDGVTLPLRFSPPAGTCPASSSRTPAINHDVSMYNMICGLHLCMSSYTLGWRLGTVSM